MSFWAGVAKLTTWILRLQQLFFAIILTGILSYMIHEFHKFHFNPVVELVVPEVFSVIALFVCFFSITAICCLGHTLQLYAAFCDFALFVGFIASAAVLHQNFHTDSTKNPLRNWLIFMRQANNEPDLRVTSTGAMVKLVDALVILEIIYFFWTTLLSIFVAHHTQKEYEKKHPERYEYREQRRYTGDGGRRHGHTHRSSRV